MANHTYKNWLTLCVPRVHPLSLVVILCKQCRFKPCNIFWYNPFPVTNTISFWLREASPHQNGWIFGKVPNGLWPPPSPLIFGKSCCGFFIRLYSLKNHTCGIFLKSPGYESIKNNDPCCQIQCLNFKFWGWLGPNTFSTLLYYNGPLDF